ncbi:hypothetical protein BZG36_04202 [Bifiguratus adelaidae]|uniref:Uncharacterized protein n=1 Tax=Bifiguratus adelaidae TaxID=1938954 RepID=A0A261XY95_9FUNG|nr:hypothetical protein BZG36_04202 [Bifiguratus adelaidae]
MTPGVPAIGIFGEIGSDSTELKQGDLAFCDPTIHARDNATYGNGAMAEPMLTPLENAVVLPKSWIKNPASGLSLLAHCVFWWYLGGPVSTGQTLLVLGATGHFGSPAVLIALAMGAKKVIIPGRNKR